MAKGILLNRISGSKGIRLQPDAQAARRLSTANPTSPNSAGLSPEIFNGLLRFIMVTVTTFATYYSSKILVLIFSSI